MEAFGRIRSIGDVAPVRNASRRSDPRLFALVLLATIGCRGAGEDTDRMVPRSWKGNPWGPEANAARLRGDLPVVPNNPDMAQWDAWGRRNLRDGDILFRMGDARAAFGLLPFSKLSAAIAASRFSHSGIVAFEGDELVVYDTTTGGPQRQPFPIWLLDARGSIAVKRPVDPDGTIAAKAVAFCRATYKAQTPFDYNMKMGDEKFYCIELTERAYRSAGLPLSEPIRLDHLPRYGEFPKVVRLMKAFTSMEPDQTSFVIGNEAIGIWSSPNLQLVYESPDAKVPQAADVPREPAPVSAIAAQPPAGATPRR